MALASADQLRGKRSLHGDRLFAQRGKSVPLCPREGQVSAPPGTPGRPEPGWLLPDLSSPPQHRPKPVRSNGVGETLAGGSFASGSSFRRADSHKPRVSQCLAHQALASGRRALQAPRGRPGTERARLPIPVPRRDADPAAALRVCGA